MEEVKNICCKDGQKQNNKKPTPFLCKPQPFRAFTASSDRTCGSVSTATGRWKFQWRSGWGRGWGGEPPWSPGRTAAPRGRPARLSETSCRLWRPPSGSVSPPQRWCGRAGGCGLWDKVTLRSKRAAACKQLFTTPRCRIRLICSHICSEIPQNLLFCCWENVYTLSLFDNLTNWYTPTIFSYGFVSERREKVITDFQFAGLWLQVFKEFPFKKYIQVKNKSQQKYVLWLLLMILNVFDDVYQLHAADCEMLKHNCRVFLTTLLKKLPGAEQRSLCTCLDQT